MGLQTWLDHIQALDTDFVEAKQSGKPTSNLLVRRPTDREYLFIVVCLKRSFTSQLPFTFPKSQRGEGTVRPLAGARYVIVNCDLPLCWAETVRLPVHLRRPTRPRP